MTRFRGPSQFAQAPTRPSTARVKQEGLQAECICSLWPATGKSLIEEFSQFTTFNASLTTRPSCTRRMISSLASIQVQALAQASQVPLGLHESPGLQAPTPGPSFSGNSKW